MLQRLFTEQPPPLQDSPLQNGPPLSPQQSKISKESLLLSSCMVPGSLFIKKGAFWEWYNLNSYEQFLETCHVSKCYSQTRGRLISLETSVWLFVSTSWPELISNLIDLTSSIFDSSRCTSWLRAIEGKLQSTASPLKHSFILGIKKIARRNNSSRIVPYIR